VLYNSQHKVIFKYKVKEIVLNSLYKMNNILIKLKWQINRNLKNLYNVKIN